MRPYFYLCLFYLSLILSASAQESTDSKLYHVLLIEWTDSLDLETKKEILEGFENLSEVTPGLEKIKIRPISNSPNHFDEVVIMVFRDKVALESYQENPNHLALKKLAGPYIKEMSKYDYWD